MSLSPWFFPLREGYCMLKTARILSDVWRYGWFLICWICTSLQVSLVLSNLYPLQQRIRSSSSLTVHSRYSYKLLITELKTSASISSYIAKLCGVANHYQKSKIKISTTDALFDPQKVFFISRPHRKSTSFYRTQTSVLPENPPKQAPKNHKPDSHI